MPSRAVTTWRVGSAGGTRVAVSEATDKPVTPWSVAAFLPGSGVAQLGPTAFGKPFVCLTCLTTDINQK